MMADAIVAETNLNQIVPMVEQDFRWGSNGVVMNKAMVLLKAYKLDPKPAYYAQALARLEYILGRNPIGLSYITQVGDNTVKYIHHRQSEADEIAAPVPGWLAGGPHSGGQDMDDCEKDGAGYDTTYPASSYVDHWCSYATNEVAINWNAPLVYVMAGILAAQ